MSVEEQITNFLRKKIGGWPKEPILKADENFSWKHHSWAVAKHCPQYLDPENYNWEKASYSIAEYAPKYFDPEKYNWKEDSWAVPQHCPQHFNPEKYNWERDSRYVGEFCPDLINTQKYNWEASSWALILNHPNHKYIENCVWGNPTLETIKKVFEYSNEYHVWRRYEDKLQDLQDPTKRKILLNRISKEIALEKI